MAKFDAGRPVFVERVVEPAADRPADAHGIVIFSEGRGEEILGGCAARAKKQEAIHGQADAPSTPSHGVHARRERRAGVPSRVQIVGRVDLGLAADHELTQSPIHASEGTAENVRRAVRSQDRRQAGQVEGFRDMPPRERRASANVKARPFGESAGDILLGLRRSLLAPSCRRQSAIPGELVGLRCVLNAAPDGGVKLQILVEPIGPAEIDRARVAIAQRIRRFTG